MESRLAYDRGMILGINKLSSQKSEWLNRLFACIDSMDAQGYAEFFEEDGQFRFANHEPAKGREAIAGVAQMIFDQLDSIRHECINAWEQESFVFAEGRVYYAKKDGSKLDFPLFSVYEFESSGRLIHDYRVYIDVTGLF